MLDPSFQSTDDFGRNVYAPMVNPGDIKSDRIGNTPESINNAILTKGWLRIRNDDLELKVPQSKDEEKASMKNIFRKPLQIEGTNVSQEPLNMNETYVTAKDDSDGFLINPLYKYNSTKFVPCLNCFYFRISGLSIYFTQLKEDMTVIGQMAIKNIKEIINDKEDPACFDLKNFKTSWKLCASTKIEAQEWYCSLKYALRMPCDGKAQSDYGDDKEIKEIEGSYNIIQPEWILPMPSPWCNEDWDYSKLGTDWQCRCWDGQNQSPIDLPPIERLETISMGADIQFHKVDTEMIVDRNYVTLLPKDKEKGFGTLTSYIGEEYKAIQVVFHHESDHTMNGFRYPLEAQIIYEPLDKMKVAGKKAIVSVLFTEDVGKKNPVLDIFNWDMLDGHGVYAGDAGIDIGKMFTDGKKQQGASISNSIRFNYYLYGGSLPYPPCDENVWMIVKSSPIGIGNFYAETFKKVRDFYWSAGKLYRQSKNWRGTYRVLKDDHMSKSKERKVYYVKNAGCGSEEDEDEEDIEAQEGHWEAIKNEHQTYIYVDQSKPSGLPGSFIISSKEVGK